MELASSIQIFAHSDHRLQLLFGYLFRLFYRLLQELRNISIRWIYYVNQLVDGCFVCSRVIGCLTDPVC